MFLRNGFVFFLFVFLILSETGCQRRGHEEKVQLRVALWSIAHELPIWQEAIKSFTDKHPEVNVELEYSSYGDYENKIVTQIAGGVPPDVIMGAQHMIFRFQEKGALLNLTPYIKEDKEFNLGEFFPEIIEPFMDEENVYSLPFGLDMYNCLFYNKNLFDEAGLSYPEDDWTWDEFLKDAKALTLRDNEGRVKRYGFLTWHWANFVFSNGGNLVDNIKNPTRLTIDEPGAKESIQFFIDLIHKYKVMPPPYSTVRTMGSEEMFMTGQIGMISSYIGTTVVFKNIKSFDWDMTRLPKGPKAIHSAGFMGYMGFGISKKTKHPKEAWELLKFLTDEAFQRKRSEMIGTMPARIKVAKEYVKIPGKPHNKGFLLEEIKYGKNNPFSLRWAEIFDDILHPGLYSAINDGTETLDEALRKVLPRANEALRQE